MTMALPHSNDSFVEFLASDSPDNEREYLNEHYKEYDFILLGNDRPMGTVNNRNADIDSSFDSRGLEGSVGSLSRESSFHDNFMASMNGSELIQPSIKVESNGGDQLSLQYTASNGSDVCSLNDVEDCLHNDDISNNLQPGSPGERTRVSQTELFTTIKRELEESVTPSFSRDEPLGMAHARGNNDSPERQQAVCGGNATAISPASTLDISPVRNSSPSPRSVRTVLSNCSSKAGSEAPTKRKVGRPCKRKAPVVCEEKEFLTMSVQISDSNSLEKSSLLKRQFSFRGISFKTPKFMKTFIHDLYPECPRSEWNVAWISTVNGQREICNLVSGTKMSDLAKEPVVKLILYPKDENNQVFVKVDDVPMNVSKHRRVTQEKLKLSITERLRSADALEANGGSVSRSYKSDTAVLRWGREQFNGFDETSADMCSVKVAIESCRCLRRVTKVCRIAFVDLDFIQILDWNICKFFSAVFKWVDSDSDLKMRLENLATKYSQKGNSFMQQYLTCIYELVSNSVIGLSNIWPRIYNEFSQKVVFVPNCK
eukprot:Nk52_evm16s2462 gene=Nk52_evmTU16s2462